MTMNTVNEILAQRQTTHGDFTDNARISQTIRRAMQAEPGWRRLSDVQREALEMIALKIGRVVTGDPNYRDHWDDIAGYARLASERTKVPLGSPESFRTTEKKI